MDMVISAGKSRKNVDAYILLPPDARHAVDLLIQTRSAVGVPDTNPYVFARLSTNTPLSGNAELQEVVRECPGVKCPERITSTLLRRYIATVSQVCNFFAPAYNTLSCATAFISFVLYITCSCMLKTIMTGIMKTDAVETRSNPKRGETCAPFGGCWPLQLIVLFCIHVISFKVVR